VRTPQPTGKSKLNALHGWCMQARADGTAGSGSGRSWRIASCVALQAVVGEEMPDTMWVHELQEILAERACVVRKLSPVQRKCGPRSAAVKQFLVRGSFLMRHGC